MRIRPPRRAHDGESGWLHDALLPVLEAALLAERRLVAIEIARAAASAILIATVIRVAALDYGHDFDRTHEAVTGRSRRNHRIVFQGEVYNPPIAWRHRIDDH